MLKYIIHKTEIAPSFTGVWKGQIWQKAETLWVTQFHPQSSSHHPHPERGAQNRGLH